MASPMGGNNVALAMEIAEKHQAGELNAKAKSEVPLKRKQITLYKSSIRSIGD